jgi:hypothetical protein
LGTLFLRDIVGLFILFKFLFVFFGKLSQVLKNRLLLDVGVIPGILLIKFIIDEPLMFIYKLGEDCYKEATLVVIVREDTEAPLQVERVVLVLLGSVGLII